MRRIIWLLIISFVLLPVHQAAAQQSAAQIRKGGYEQIEVTRFEIDDGIDFPPAYMDSINEEIIARHYAVPDAERGPSIYPRLSSDGRQYFSSLPR